jgi:hypothetical protein
LSLLIEINKQSKATLAVNKLRRKRTYALYADLTKLDASKHKLS